MVVGSLKCVVNRYVMQNKPGGDMGDNSNSAIVEQARSGKRYEIRDKALVSISRQTSCTSSEIAMNVLAVEGVQSSDLSILDVVRISVRVASIQKRVSDLLKLNYIRESSRRVCKVTNYSASVYVITQSGQQYLNKKGMAPKRPVVRTEKNDKGCSKSAGIAALRESKLLLS